jgi:hypothetical protein
MTDFFSSTRGGITLYVDSHDGTLTDCRFVMARFGEDPDKVVATFWREHGDANFSIVPLFAYGSAPRAALCTQRSLAAAMQSVEIEPSGVVEQQWRAACEALNVAWPKRLQAA